MAFCCRNITAIIAGKDDDGILWIKTGRRISCAAGCSEIPSWLPTPFAELPTKGYIGLQGKHGDANIFFRNVRIAGI